MFIKEFKIFTRVLKACGVILICFALLTGQTYTGSPVTKVRMLQVISSREYPMPKIIEIINEQGVNFKITPEVEEELLAIKTRPQIITALKNNYRAPVVARPTMQNTNAILQNTTIRVPVSNQMSANVQTSIQTSDEKYEELYFKGLDILKQMRSATNPSQMSGLADQIIEIGYQATLIDRSRPEAYKLVGSGLMFNREFDKAEGAGQKALDRGGTIAFTVYHLAGVPHLEVIHLGKNYITIESNQEFFEFKTDEILEVSPQGFYRLPNGASVAVLGIATYKNGRRDAWYFTPAVSGTSPEVQMIVNLIKRNASGGK